MQNLQTRYILFFPAFLETVAKMGKLFSFFFASYSGSNQNDTQNVPVVDMNARQNDVAIENEILTASMDNRREINEDANGSAIDMIDVNVIQSDEPMPTLPTM